MIWESEEALRVVYLDAGSTFFLLCLAHDPLMLH
jgi:hypothetical protein